MKADTSPAALRAHAHALAAAFHVSIEEVSDLKPEDASAILYTNGRRVVRCAPISDETTYAVALHEVGHLAAPSGTLRHVVKDGDALNLQLIEEEAAWAWAKHYALIWTGPMAAVVSYGFGTYRDAQRQRRRATTTATAPAPVLSIDWTQYSRKKK